MTTVTLFEDTNFRGSSVTVTTSAHNLQDFHIGPFWAWTMNDKTSSMIVSGGHASVWTQADYHGEGWDVPPGSYGDVTDIHNIVTGSAIPDNSISSVWIP